MKNKIINSGSKARFKRRIIIGILSFILIFCGFIYIIIFRLRPMIYPIAQARAKSIATHAINLAVEDELSTLDMGYEDIVTFTFDNENRVTSLQTDSLKINQLKSKLSVAIVNKISQMDNTTLSIYLGDVISSELFSHKGPKMNIVLSPVGYVETDIQNSFTSAGINQTRHQLILSVTATIGIVLPTYTEYSEVNTGIVLGESILLGNVPESYTNVGDDRISQDLWDDINNYS